jgi:hypothetical protein
LVQISRMISSPSHGWLRAQTDQAGFDGLQSSNDCEA